MEISGEDFHSKVRRACPAVRGIALSDLVDDFQRHGRFGDYLAYSFNAFLVQEYGEGPFAAFYRAAGQDTCAVKMEEIFGLKPETIEQRWKTFLCGAS